MTVSALGQRLRRWLRPPRSLQFTREGKYFVGITIGVGFAAINTGNNLLYLLLGMLLSLIVASGVLSEISLRDLKSTRLPPVRIFANRPVLMGIGLLNEKKRLPSFSLEVEDLVDDKPLDKRCYFLKLPAGRAQNTSYRHVFPRRGRYAFSGFRISTKFPFALFRKSREVALAEEVIVFPELVPIERFTGTLSLPNGVGARPERRREGDFLGLREYRQGDDPRSIHWPSTAKRGRLLTREHEDPTARRIVLLLDNGLPNGADCKDDLERGGLERAISICASLALDFLERGFEVRVASRDRDFGWFSGPHQSTTILRALALLTATDDSLPWASTGQTPPIVIQRRGARRSIAASRVVEA